MTLRSVTFKALHLFESWFSLLWGSFDKFKHRRTNNSRRASSILCQQVMSFEWSATWALDLNWGERVWVIPASWKRVPSIIQKRAFLKPSVKVQSTEELFVNWTFHRLPWLANAAAVFGRMIGTLSSVSSHSPLHLAINLKHNRISFSW